MRTTRATITVSLAATLSLTAWIAVAGPAAASPVGHVDDDGGHDHHQHGGTDGHLPPESSNVRVVGKARINQDQVGRVADVAVHGNYAYLGAYADPKCQKGGVYVFDIANPAAPKQINFIRTANDSYVGEGVQVIRIDTPAFTGDVLAYNNETCGTARQAGGGLSLVDVTNPKVHRYLAEHVGDVTPASANGAGFAHDIHSAFIWDAGDRAYAVLVDNEESADVDILDITDPRRPVLVAEYDIAAQFPQALQNHDGLREVFLHDVVVEQIGGRWVMLLSYWDAGYVTLDVTNPLAPAYIADTDYAFPDVEAAESGLSVDPEGNGHQAEFSLNRDYIVAADEDFDPYVARLRNVDEGGFVKASQGSDTVLLGDGDVIEGQSRFVGRACDGDTAVPAGDGTQIAVVARGLCTFTEKIANVEAAGGYIGAVVYNREGSDACSTPFGMSVTGGIPAVSVGRDVGFGLFDTTYDEAECRASIADAGELPAAIGAVGDRIRVDSFFDGWGYVHLYRNGTGKLAELDTYAIPQAHDPAFAEGYGDLSVHEVAMSHKRNELAYFAYYSGGFRVARIVGDQLVETGAFVDQGGNNFWGVQVWQHKGKEYVLASDRDFGLYIFEYTGPGAP